MSFSSRDDMRRAPEDRHKPAWLRLAGLGLPHRYRHEILADLAEERGQMLRRGRSAMYSAAWLAWHVALSSVASRRGPRQPARSVTPGRARVPSGPGFGRELHQAARSLRRTPWYAATIIAVVALSMTLATTVFAIVDGVLFRPLPYPDADELYAVGGVYPDGVESSGRGIEMLSPREVTALRTNAPNVMVTGLVYTSLQLPDGIPIDAVGIDHRFFDVFGVRLRLGGFSDDQFTPVPQTDTIRLVPALISYEVWQEHFDGDPDVLGQVIRPPGVLGIPYEITGVLEPGGFVPPVPRAPAAGLASRRQVDLLMPWMSAPDFGERGLVAFARVAEDALPAARSALDRAMARYATTVAPPPAGASPTERRRSAYAAADLQPLGAYLTERQRPMFTIVFGTVMALVVLVLLNASALAAARAAHRSRETTLRRALGARTGDLFRHAIAEQAVLAIPGALLGLTLSPLLLRATLDLLPPGLSLIKQPQVDWRVAVFAGVVTMTTTFVVALFPVARSFHGRDAGSLTNLPGRPTPRGLMGRSLICAQVALAFVMLLGGTFFATSLARVWAEEPGFRTENAAIIRVLTNRTITRARGIELAESMRRVPGVSGAAAFSSIVLSSSYSRSRFTPVDVDVPIEDRPAVFEIGPGFFDATEIALRAGRLPSDAELSSGAPVIAVSEAVAATFWPNQPAIGQTIVPGRPVPFTVVGVVADARWQSPDTAPVGAIYMPWVDPEGRWETFSFPMFVSLEGDVDASLESAVRHVHEADPDFRTFRVERLEDAVAGTVRARRFGALAASVFGGVALLIVSVGLLGLVAMTASRRTREVGIRMALGARRSGVVRQLLFEQLGAVIVGILSGAVMAAWAMRLLQSQFYETAPSDPVVWLTAVVVMLTTATGGALVPAIRASHVDPLQALRED